MRAHACGRTHTHTHCKGSLKSESMARKSGISLSEPPAALTWVTVAALSPFNCPFLTQILLKLKRNHVIFLLRTLPWLPGSFRVKVKILDLQGTTWPQFQVPVVLICPGHTSFLDVLQAHRKAVTLGLLLIFLIRTLFPT